MSVQVGDALIQDAAFSDALGKFARHEAMLMSAFTKTLKMLLLLQVSRSSGKAESVTLSAVAVTRAA